MVRRDILKGVALFADLPADDLEMLCLSSDEVQLGAGQMLFPEGAAGDKAYVVLEGQMEVIKDSSGREVLLNVLKAGDVLGEIALLEDKPRMASVRARTHATLMVVRKETLDQLLNTSLSAARALFYTMLTRWRSTEALLRQSEKMAQLGTLSAGVAHELNNPAAAVRRAADQLSQAINDLGAAESRLAGLELDRPQREKLALAVIEVRARAVKPPVLGALGRSNLEGQVDTWLSARNVPDAWEIAPAVVEMGFDQAGVEELSAVVTADNLGVIVGWLHTQHAISTLLAEIGMGAGRISDIVKALKSYSFLDQGPVQIVDIHEGLDNTLVILRHKLREGIVVVKDYAQDLPKIQAYGSELNQVWTNIIDNACDAMDGKGRIILRTRREDHFIWVEIEDNGPGIPAAIQGKIFDPFFTTKPPGKGTGLGLDITYNIVVQKHRGDIKVESERGRTVFRVQLPINVDSK